MLCRATDNVQPLTARRPPKDFDTFSTCRIGAFCPPALTLDRTPVPWSASFDQLRATQYSSRPRLTARAGGCDTRPGMSLGAYSAIFGTSFVVSLSGALSPGPLTTLAVRESVRLGAWAGPALALGHAAIEALLVTALALGLSETLDDDAVTAAVALLGGGFLLYLGLQTVRAARSAELDIRPGAESRKEAGPLRPGAALWLAGAGVAVSVTNPFWLAWWATVGAAYIVESLDHGAAGVGVFYTAHVITDIGWLSLIAVLLAGGRRLMSRGLYRLVLFACGLFLLVLAGWFLATGLGHVA